MPRKNAIMFSKPDEPAFLRRIKAKIGYREGPTVDTKNEQLPDASEGDYTDRDDEKPVIVIPKNSKVTEQEAQEFIKKEGEEEEVKKKISFDNDELKHQPGDRLIFRKPNKTGNQESTSKIGVQNNKRSKEDGHSSSRPKMAKFDDKKKLKDNRLLSFGDDEED